ncbi:SDR family NAD(P)-dependent oxidoreductase [Polynucleobacter paneuropaeus]|nr:SDR family NAD(P)-dependent oxidoreductase [Polynucleobacter paneuropaeus]
MVKRALIYGGSGDLASRFASQLITSGVQVDVVFRGDAIDDERVKKYNNVYIEKSGYSNFEPSVHYDIIFFPQGIFEPMPFVETNAEVLKNEFQVGLLDIMTLTRKHLDLMKNSIDTGRRVDFAYIGSTSAYAGFKNTAIYCAVKHGLLGFVRAMNDEYSQTNIRFWLFSMGSMKNQMGSKLKNQDFNTFLDPDEVAKRISNALLAEGNQFEPEIIIKRRFIG